MEQLFFSFCVLSSLHSKTCLKWLFRFGNKHKESKFCIYQSTPLLILGDWAGSIVRDVKCFLLAETKEKKGRKKKAQKDGNGMVPTKLGTKISIPPSFMCWKCHFKTCFIQIREAGILFASFLRWHQSIWLKSIAFGFFIVTLKIEKIIDLNLSRDP